MIVTQKHCKVEHRIIDRTVPGPYMVHVEPGSGRTDGPRTNNKRGRGLLVSGCTIKTALPLSPGDVSHPMPPQPGVFPLPYASTSTHKARANPIEIHNGTTDIVTSYPPPAHHTIHHPSSALLAGPSSRPHGTSLLCPVSCINSVIRCFTGANADEGKKDRRRKEIVGRLGKEMDDRRDECVSLLRSLVPPAFKQRGVCVPSGRQYAESVSALHSVAMQLAARPETLPSYKLRLYPLSIECSALLAQLEVEEQNSLESAEAAYELERECVEEEWKRSRDRIRERLLRRWWIPRSHSRYCLVFHLSLRECYMESCPWVGCLAPGSE